QGPRGARGLDPRGTGRRDSPRAPLPQDAGGWHSSGRRARRRLPARARSPRRAARRGSRAREALGRSARRSPGLRRVTGSRRDPHGARRPRRSRGQRGSGGGPGARRGRPRRTHGRAHRAPGAPPRRGRRQARARDRRVAPRAFPFRLPGFREARQRQPRGNVNEVGNDPLGALEIWRQGTEALRRRLVADIKREVEMRGHPRVALGLSGGLDSAVAAMLCVEALGADNVLAVLMPLRTTDPSSVSIAQGLVNSLGLTSRPVNMSPAVDSYFANLPRAPPPSPPPPPNPPRSRRGLGARRHAARSRLALRRFGRAGLEPHRHGAALRRGPAGAALLGEAARPPVEDAGAIARRVDEPD